MRPADIELPPLPEARRPDPNGLGWFTAGQMHAYGRACEAAAMERAAQLCEAHAREPQMIVVSRITDTPRETISRECAETIRAAAKEPKP